MINGVAIRQQAFQVAVRRCLEAAGERETARGHVECPACHKRLQYAAELVHGRRQLWGECETAGCLRWLL